MEEYRPPAKEPVLESRIREMGFDPMQLTRREAEELLEIRRRCPDEVLPTVSR